MILWFTGFKKEDKNLLCSYVVLQSFLDNSYFMALGKI